MKPPFPIKHPELRLDPIEFLILLKLKSKDYELKELTKSIQKEFAGLMDITYEDIFKRLENLRANQFIEMETRGLIAKKNVFKLTIKGEEKLREEIDYFKQDILIFNKFYSIVLGLLGTSFPKMVDDVRKIIEGSLSNIQQTVNSLSKPVRDAILNMLSEIIKKSKSPSAENET